MENNDKLYKKYLKYKEKYLYLQQIAAGYQEQKDFKAQITQQEKKIQDITNNINTTKEQLKTAMNAELASIENYNKDVTNKETQAQLNKDKGVVKGLKSKLDGMERTLPQAQTELGKIILKERDSKQKIAENNVNYAKKILLEKRKVIKKIEDKITKLQTQLKKAEEELATAKTKEAEANSKLDETNKALIQVQQEELSRLSGTTGSPASPPATPTSEPPAKA
jgi:chromosome segregation ATPase